MGEAFITRRGLLKNGFPDGWKQPAQGEAIEPISKYAPIVQQSYGNWETAISPLLNTPTFNTSGQNSGSVNYTPDSNFLFVAHESVPDTKYIYGYSCNNDIYSLIGSPVVPPSSYVMSADISPDGSLYAAGLNASPFLVIYRINNGVLTKLANPSVMPSAQVYAIKFSPDGTKLFVSNYASPWYYVYQVSGNSLTLISNTTLGLTNPPSTINTISFSPDGTLMATGFTSSPYIMIQQYDYGSGKFTKLTNPSGSPTTAVYGSAFSPLGNLLVFSGTSAAISAYAVSGTTFAKLSSPSGLPQNGSDVKITSDGRYLAVIGNASPYFCVCKIEGQSITKLNNPYYLNQGYPNAIAINPTNKYVALELRYSPGFMVYSAADARVIIRNATKWSNSPIYWAPPGNFGMSLQAAAIGEQCKVNLFPAINQLQ